MPDNNAGTTIVATPALAAMSASATPVDTSLPVNEPKAPTTPSPLPPPPPADPAIIPDMPVDSDDGQAAADAMAKAKAAASSAAKAAAPSVPSAKTANPAAAAAPDVKASDVVVPPSSAMPLDFEQEDAKAATSELLAEVVHKIGESHNVLVALSSDPSVDEMAAAIGLSMYLDKLGKRATTIYSGTTPNALEFLKPEETFETTVDVLQDFVIALNKEKADHLRYKLDGDYVKIFITPYRSKISKEDLEFSYGDFNVDLVMALDVANGVDLDAALREYGRIMHDAVVINITTGNPGKLGEIEWSDKSASSVSEMIARLLYRVNSKVKIDKDEATAFLTGIVAATDRFSNLSTTPETMRIASKLMESGANQQLVAKNITPEVENEIFSLSGGGASEKKSDTTDPTRLETHEKDDDKGSSVAGATAGMDVTDAALLNDLKAAEASLAGAGAEVTSEASREPLKIGDDGALADEVKSEASVGDATESGNMVAEAPVDDLVGDADDSSEKKLESASGEDDSVKAGSEGPSSADTRLAAQDESEFTLEPEVDASAEPEFSFEPDASESDGVVDLELAPDTENIEAVSDSGAASVEPEAGSDTSAVPELVAPENLTPVGSAVVSEVASTDVPAPAVEPVATDVVEPVSAPEVAAATEITPTTDAATSTVAPAPTEESVAVPTPTAETSASGAAPAGTENGEYSGTEMPGGGFVSNKPEKVIQPPEDMKMGLDGGLEKNKYGHMLEEALASVNEVPTAMMQPAPVPMPAQMPQMPMPGTMPTPMPTGNPAAMGAPVVASAPEINGVPQINYMPMPGDGMLPPPPTPPINMNTPVSGPGGMPMPAVVPVITNPPAGTNTPMMPNPGEAMLPTAMPIAPAAPAPTPTPMPLGPQPAMQDQVYAPQAADPSAFRIPGM